MDHDAAHKYIHGLPEVAADLLRLVAGDWVDELDPATLEDRSAEFLDDAHRKRHGDLAFSGRLRRGRLANGQRPYLLVLLEFQSEVDRSMARRVREYAEMLLQRVARSGAAEREGGLPWVLPVVVYNGSEPWTAAGQATDLAPLPSGRMARDLALLQPQAYRLLAAGGTLTSGAVPAEDWPLDNRVSATVRLQASGTPQELLPCLREEATRFPGAANEAFRQALHAWARALWEHGTGDGSGFPTFDELERKEETAMPTVAEAAWDRWEAKVRAEGFEQGIAQGVKRGIAQGVERGIAQGVERGIDQGVERGVRQGRAELLRRQASLKFDNDTAQRLAGLLDSLTAQDDLDRVGDWILECSDGDELLSRVSGLLPDG